MWLTLLSVALALPVGFGRVDLVSEAPGTWIHDEAPALGLAPTGPAVRLVEQVSLVWTLPVKGLTVQTSLATQSLDYERILIRRGPVSGWWHGGLQTRLLVPSGCTVGLAGRYRFLRVGVGLSVISGAGWGNLRWDWWRVLPTVGLGIGPRS